MFLDPWIVLGAAMAEACVGYPGWLHRRLPHPVVWLGGAISSLEARWNSGDSSPARRKLLGVGAIALVAGVAGLAGHLIERASGPLVVTVTVLLGTLGLAQRSLFDHVRAVITPLRQGNLPAARIAVSAIVGRDVDRLDEAGVASAALESLAESFNDGVLAPLFWFLIGGLPGLFAYKAVNTADSLIGHMEPRWRQFGWASARLDDLMNLIPARIAGALIAVAGNGGWEVMLRDASQHASPNSGWPEAAMAGALKIRLGGVATYDGVSVERPVFGDRGRPTVRDLERGLRLYVVACSLAWLGLAVGGLAWPR